MTEVEDGLVGDGAAREGTPSSPETVAQPAPAQPARTSAIRRLLEWLWSGAEMKALLGSLPVRAARELERRARLSLELARLAVEQTFENGPAEAVACDLNRQAVYWALLAAHDLAQPSPPMSPGVARPSFANAWRDADRALLARALGGTAAVEALDGELESISFAELAELEPVARERLSGTLRQLAQKILAELDTTDREVDRIWARRALRIGGVLVLVSILVVIPMLVSSFIEQRRDLAVGKPWTTSSKFPGVGCTSPLQACPESTGYFFHTVEEENPWFIVDLLAPQTVSAVRVQNRADCCAERAVPLVVETSLDKKSWQRVARRTDEFTDWKAKFPPTSARFVRLTVPRRTLLHLQTVRVLP